MSEDYDGIELWLTKECDFRHLSSRPREDDMPSPDALMARVHESLIRTGEWISRAERLATVRIASVGDPPRYKVTVGDSVFISGSFYSLESAMSVGSMFASVLSAAITAGTLDNIVVDV